MFRRPAVALLTVLALTACGSSSTASSHPTPSSSPIVSATSPTAGAGFPSPTPGGTAPVSAVPVSCPSPPTAGERLALVMLRNTTGVVVRDITDILHPVTRCTLGGGRYFRFISATRISYIVYASSDLGAPGALYMVDLATATTSLVRSWSYGGYMSWVYAWSPDGTQLTYLSSDTSGVKWHLLSAAGDHLLSSLGTVPPRDVNTDNDDGMVGFSADGQYVALEETFTYSTKGTVTGTAPPIQIIRLSDSSTVYTRTTGTMGVWAGAGARFYFRDTDGLHVWIASGVSNVASGSGWIHPWASPDGSRIAFSLLNAQGNHVGFVIDITSGAVHALSALPRVGAAFLNAALVWYAGESICTTATPCGLGGPPLSGQTYIYDLGADVENNSIDTAFYDSWPHVVGQA